MWEDLEAMEGQEHSQLITGDRTRVQIWDLNQQSLEKEIQTDQLVDGVDDAECLAVKRDPHDQKLIALALEDSVRVVDLRKPADRSADLTFVAHMDQVLDLAYN